MNILSKFFFYSLAFFFLILIRCLKPFILIRLGALVGDRIGHFGSNTELYLCEKDAGINVPNRRYIDFFFIREPVCNTQLKKMWKKVLYIFPQNLLWPVLRLNSTLPGGSEHLVGDNTSGERDVNNLLENYPQHLFFDELDQEKGKAELIKMGIVPGSKFVCLIVRDSAYLNKKFNKDWSYHNYRDGEINDYMTAAIELSRRGYYVIRMGALVNKEFKSPDPKIIDYASSENRNDFMDIYLGAHCEFCISSATGWDAIPGWIFRKPICFVNHAPIGQLISWNKDSVVLSKHYFDPKLKRNLSLDEIFSRDLAFAIKSSDYEDKGIIVIDNTAEEIYDVVTEMEERINNKFTTNDENLTLQKLFLNKYINGPTEYFDGKKMHGKIKMIYSSNFLKKNKKWLYGQSE